MLSIFKPTKSYSLSAYRNIAFSRVIKAGGRPREFNFRRKHADDAIVYDIDVSDENGNRHYFSLREVSGNWRMHEQFLPPWIAEIFPSLALLIKEAEQQVSFS